MTPVILSLMKHNQATTFVVSLTVAAMKIGGYFSKLAGQILAKLTERDILLRLNIYAG